MYWLGLCRLALSNLLIYKLRSALTILSMIFGTGAVIATLSSNEGAARYIRNELEKIGANTITVRVEAAGPFPFRETDKELLRKYARYFDTLSMVHEMKGAMARHLASVTSVGVSGIESAFFKASRLGFSSGRPFDDAENLRSDLVATLGAGAKKALFGNGNAVGEYVTLMAGEAILPVRIVGVLKEKGGQYSTQVDSGIFMPVRTVRKIAPPNSLSTYLAATLLNDDWSAAAKKYIQLILAPRFPSGMKVSDAREMIERTRNIWNKQNLVGICLAMISLLTGGVGIMNIMLLSVSQRRREIGLRKAVGANDWHILFQFLIEAVTVCLAGGVLGILAGSIFGRKIASLMGQWEAAVSLSTVLLALGFATLTGILFGLLPAIKASRLDPYDALRA